ncbi:hypothetical protein pEaSNUABM42_00202 [Erwinia phage pEa_SNUABM_42]|nr:hypothetical protein pEaSNUABM43_00203 [Erwinia phage pEa_SNUABM_43]QVW55519.1 hypothetical protein pEaSNUABM42_00202 [Erwinia phage pEa_SNUABM_42]
MNKENPSESDDLEDRVRKIVVIGLGMTGISTARPIDHFAQEVKLENVKLERRFGEDWRGNQVSHERHVGKRAAKTRLWKSQRR